MRWKNCARKQYFFFTSVLVIVVDIAVFVIVIVVVVSILSHQSSTPSRLQDIQATIQSTQTKSETSSPDESM